MPKHYEVPILASMLYEYTNKEYDVVKNAFRTGNYNSIRELPNDLGPFQVAQAIKEKMQNEALFSSVQS